MPITEPAKIRASSHRYSIELMLVGVICLAVIMIFVSLRPQKITVLEIALSASAILSILVGFLKSQQPFYSIILDECSLKYIHKYGHWTINIDNFHSSGVPLLEHRGDTVELNALALKLNNIDEFLSELSPRLAGKLLIEQKHFISILIMRKYDSGEFPDGMLIEETTYVSPLGNVYTGLIAMFANRMSHFKMLTGYDLLLSANVFDREVGQFSTILNRWKLNPDKMVQSLLD